MRSTCHAITLASLIALTLCGCSSGGGSSAISPTIIGAAFVGSGATPLEGDLLVITVSRASTLTANELLTDDDFTIASGTLGRVITTPTALSSNSVLITLGANVSFTPGTTTIAFSDIQNVIRSTDGALGAAGAPVIITAGDGDAPAITNLTLNSIDDGLNGRGPAGGTLMVPRNGFTIDLDHTDVSNAVDPNATFVASTRPVIVDGTARTPGSNLLDALTVAGNAASTTITVPGTVSFSDGDQTLTVLVSDTTGMTSAPALFTYIVRGFTNDIRPFEAPQVWFLDTSRDLESYDINLSLVDGANGTPDLFDLFAGVGLHSTTPITNVSGSLDSNEVVTSLFQDEVLTELATAFDGVNISFTFTAPGTFANGVSSVPFASGSFSQICIAGSADSAPSGILGSALFDPNNRTQDNNCIEAFGTNEDRLGVFPYASLIVGFVSGAASDFRTTFDPFTPRFLGTPIGEVTGDDSRLLEVIAGTNVTFDPRITEMEIAIRKMARLIAVVTAHECGHSMGLVTNGPMPNGLYGNDAINFPLSNNQPASNANGHIQNTSLFPGGSQNIMSPAINFDAAQSASTTFNSLNLSYLRERSTYVPN